MTVGISYTEYYLNSSGQPMTAYTATSGTLSVVCGRLSFTLGLKARPHSAHGRLAACNSHPAPAWHLAPCNMEGSQHSRMFGSRQRCSCQGSSPREVGLVGQGKPAL